MAQMSITAKIQVVASDEDKTLLDETMSVYREACNYVSDYVFRTHDLKQFSLNKALYPTLRAEFGLKSQMTQSVFKTVIARYRTILENQKEDPGSHPEKEGHDQQEKPVIGYKKKMAENAGRNRGHVSVEPQGHPRFLY